VFAIADTKEIQFDVLCLLKGKEKMNVGIIGLGIIGTAIRKLFENSGIECKIYDPAKGLLNQDAFKAYYTFICVPTDLQNDGRLDMAIVRQVVPKCEGIAIICSTLQPETADSLSGRIVVQPEYFGETQAHPMTDLISQKFLILGGDNEDVNEVIELYKNVYNADIRIRKVTKLEAEIIKLSENRAIAFKVAQCQELYDACVAANVDYETIRQAVYGDDPRFNLWWTFIYKQRGFKSKCIPKDVYAWREWCKSNSDVTNAILKRNEVLIGRKER